MRPRRRNPNTDFVPIYRRKLGVDRVAWLEDAAENGKCSISTVITKIIRDVIDDERAAE